METAKNKKFFNIIMVAVIAVIVIGGMFAVGSVKGWFGGEDASLAKADKVTGIVSVERAGVSFELEKGASLQADDVITVNEKAGIVIKSAGNTFELAENSSAKLIDSGEGVLQVELTAGEIFVVAADDEAAGNIAAQGNQINSQEGVFAVNIQTGSMGINVFAGKVTATVGGKAVEAQAGQSILVVGDEATVGTLSAESLNSFNLQKAIEASKNNDLCFTKEQLEKVVDDRDAAVEEDADDAKDGDVVEKDDEGNNNNSSAGNSGNSSDKPSGGDSGDSGNSSAGDSGNATTPTTPKLTCTIEIRCDTILNNMDNLTPGKEGYVPSSGVILKTTTVEFTEGETVFDVLKRVCSSKGIQLEYSWSPIYGSQYIEGINHLYEFDCGDLSGWCYKVNGWAPNYGVSVYQLEDGDSIKFLYSCEGAGADVGA